MQKLNNFHHKASSDYISKQKIKNQITSSAVIFKSNVMNIKINNISNSKDGYIFIPNSKAINGRSFDKELQENKQIIKNYLKNEKTKKDSEKNSLEIESKDEVSTNNLTESLQYFTDMNLNIKGHGGTNLCQGNGNYNYNNYINNNINKKLSTINARNNTNSNYIPTISINIKKNDKENRLKANIDIKAKVKNKKCLNINNNKINKKGNNISNSNMNGIKINETFNKGITKESFDNKIYKKNIHNSYNKEKDKKSNFQNKEFCQTKRKLSNLVDDTTNKTLFPSKCKTQNYLNNLNNGNNATNINYHSNRKISINNLNNDNCNNSYESNNINQLIKSKKKLFIKNNEKENKENKLIKDNKEMSNKKKTQTKNIVNNIKLKQKNVLLLKSISVAQKLLRTKSPMNKNAITLNNMNYYENNHTINQESTYKDFYTMKNNTDRRKEDNINSSNKNIISNTKNNNNNIVNKISLSKKNKNEKKISKTSQKHSLIKKPDNIKPKKLESGKNNNNNIIIKKKKNSHNNVVNINSSNKKIKIETSFEENSLLKSKNSKDVSLNNSNSKHVSFQQNNSPIINKVLIFEIGNSKILNNMNNNLNNNINNSNNHSYKNIIHMENSKTNKNILYNEETPKKNKLTDIIKKNIEYNKENKNSKLINNTKSLSNYINDSFFGENTATPIDHKHAFNKNKKYSENNEEKSNKSGNNINKLSDYKNNYKNKQIEKDFGDMETPILLNTPKLTGRIIDAKLNLFEKMKSIKTENENMKIEKKHKIENNKIVNKLSNKYKDDNSTETEDIIYQEGSISSNKNTINNKKPKNKKTIDKKIKHKKTLINILEYLLSLNEKCLNVIFNYFDLAMINTITLLNKKYYACFKYIINQTIKNKILLFYKEKNKFNNNIKLSLMKVSSLSKLSPLLLHKKYVDLLLESNNKYDKEIQKDLTRTFPDNLSFKYGNSNYNKLYHLLTVYSQYNPKIGYAQGINFLVAYIIILFDKEEEGFVFLDALMQKFEFEKLLGVNNDLHKKLDNIGMYLKKYCPEIYNYLDSVFLSHEFFTTNWMITLFSNSMEKKYLFIVWDFLIIYGWKFFRYFVVSVLNVYKKNILEEEQNNLTFFMKKVLKNERFKEEFEKIIDKVFELMNKENNIV